MKKIKQILMVCALLIAIGANSANAQNCPNAGCEFNNIQITGSSTMYHWSVEFYGLPQVAQASYVWGTGGFLQVFSGGFSPGVGLASEYYGNGNSNNQHDVVCSVNCYVTCRFGHTHYFSKKIIISW